MELVLHGVAVPVKAEVAEEEAEVQEGWEEPGPGQDLAGSASAHPVARGYPIRLVFPATKLNVQNVVHRWCVDKMRIAVASGKGGTGKTLVAVNLALSLSVENRIQLLDCDVEEPNDHIFINPEIVRRDPVLIQVPEVDENNCDYCGKCASVCEYHAIAVFASHILVFPQLCHGCGACTYLCPQKAISEKGREIGVVESGKAGKVDFVQGKLTVGEALAPPVIREVKKRAREEGTVIIDVSPGTSCTVVEAVRGSDFCLLVTEPTPFGLNDLGLAVEMVKKLGIPSGVVINRVSIGDKHITDYCKKKGIPILLRIPLDSSIARLYSKGILLVEGMPEWKRRFVGLFHRIMEFSYERGSGVKR